MKARWWGRDPTLKTRNNTREKGSRKKPERAEEGQEVTSKEGGKSKYVRSKYLAATLQKGNGNPMNFENPRSELARQIHVPGE